MKAGKNIFTKKAIMLLAFCFFLDGIMIGAFVAFGQSVGSFSGIIPLLIFLFLPFILFYSSIKKEIKIEQVKENKG